jgi:hypothetical protein
MVKNLQNTYDLKVQRLSFKNETCYKNLSNYHVRMNAHFNACSKTLPTIWRTQIRNRVTDSMRTKAINLLLPGAYFIFQQINNHQDKQ